MNRFRSSKIICLFALSLAAASPSHPATAPGESQVQDLTDQEVTEQKLLEILQPADVPRGIGIVPKPQGRPHCEILRGEASRGIGIRPTADIAAIRINFASNSAKILPEASHTLDALGRALSSSNLSPYCFQIQGHTDATGPNSVNDRLSRQRAEAVVRYLAAKFGVETERLVAVGYGKRQPIADNTTDDGRLKNRRVQVVNLGSGDS